MDTRWRAGKCVLFVHAFSNEAIEDPIPCPYRAVHATDPIDVCAAEAHDSGRERISKLPNQSVDVSRNRGDNLRELSTNQSEVV